MNGHNTERNDFRVNKNQGADIGREAKKEYQEKLKEYFDEKNRAARERMLRKKKKSSRPEPKPAGANRWRMVYRTHKWTTGFDNH